MRKALALLLALLVGTSAGAVCTVKQLAAPGRQVEFTETTLYGNISAAEGLRANKKVQLGGHIVWDSTIDFAADGFTTDTECFFSTNAWNEKRYQETEQRYDGVFLYDLMSAGYETTGSDLTFIGCSLRGAQQELIDQTPAGQTGQRTIRLADYGETYSVGMNVNLPGILYGGYPDIMETDPLEGPEIYAVRALQDFLQIPILPDEYYTMGVEKDVNGEVIRSWGSSEEEGDSFGIFGGSAITEDACYFYFNNRTNMGKLVDTSRIPGGYGIYILPYGFVKQENYHGYEYYEGMDVFADQLRLFYPVDPESRILRLTMSENQKTLLLHTVEQGRYLITVISTETGKATQQFVLAEDAGEEPEEAEMTEGTLVVRIGSSFSVLTLEGETQWKLAFQTVPTAIEEEKDYSPLNTWYGRKFAFDGQRLAVIAIRNQDERWSGCGFNLAVYDKDGLQYYGDFESSLEKANAAANTDNPAYFDLVKDLHEPNGVAWKQEDGGKSA